MFYCSQGSVTVQTISQRTISSAIAGGESFFQQQLTGPGIVILESMVPMAEIDMIDLYNDTLKVDGNFAVLRSSSLDFTVERSAKTLIGSAVSGEGLVNVYRGTGQVWLAPTIKVYKTLELSLIHILGRYIIKRLIQLIPILIGITFLSFAMMRLAGGDAVTYMLSLIHICIGTTA